MKAIQNILTLFFLAGMSALTKAQAPFTDMNAGLPDSNYSSVAWGDYNNDGFLDFALMGAGPPGVRIYRNNGNGTFKDIGANLADVAAGGLSWGDYDNDGDLDLVVVGLLAGAGTTTSRIYRNDGNDRFTDIQAGLEGLGTGGVSWGDFDNDGRLDLLLSGYDTNGVRRTLLYRNLGNGSFTNTGAGLQGVERSSLALGDFNNDGRVDILLTGYGPPGGSTTRLYRNDGGLNFFGNYAAPDVSSGAVAWGDYNNDGRLDFVVTGQGNKSPPVDPLPNYGRVYRNEGEMSFVDAGTGLTPVFCSAVAWGDYDNDGRLDLLLAGASGPGQAITRIYHNNAAVSNTPPTAPSGLSSSVSGQQVTLNWKPASDAQTPVLGLTYNIRVGSRPGAGDIVSPQSAPNGFRRVPQRGNAEHRLFSNVVNLKGGVYYWSVQAVDTAFAGGSFAAEQTFVVPPAFEDIHLQPDGSIQLRFLGSMGGTNYTLQASTNLTTWSTIANLMADASGMFQYTETNRTIPVRFYRVLLP